jgi:DNA-binding MarR family transcriptional regulator
VDGELDSVEWMRRRWSEEGQPAPEYFAAMAAVLRTHARLVSDVETVLKPHGFGLTTYLLMATLLTSQDFSRPLGQLSRHLMIHPTSVTLVVDRLEKDKYIRRRPHPTDRRTILAMLTPAGVKAVEKANEDLAGANFGLSGVAAKDAKALRETLKDIRVAIGDVSS